MSAKKDKNNNSKNNLSNKQIAPYERSVKIYAPPCPKANLNHPLMFIQIYIQCMSCQHVGRVDRVKHLCFMSILTLRQ